MTNHNETAEDSALVYQVRLPVSTGTVTYCADLLRAHLKQIGSRWRKLPAGRIALLVLAVLRHDARTLDLASGNDTGLMQNQGPCGGSMAIGQPGSVTMAGTARL